MTWQLLIHMGAVAWSLAVLGAAVVAFVRSRRRTEGPARPGFAEPAPLRTVLVVRPCAGEEPDLERRLIALAPSPGLRVRLVLVVADVADPAWPIAVRAEVRGRERGLECHTLVAPPTGANRKASSFAAAVAQFGPGCDAIVNADSNVELSGFDLAALVEPLAGGNCGAVWAPPVEVPGTSHPASQAILGASLHSFPLLAGIDGATLVGKLFALDAQALDRCGGFAPLAEWLGEDVELSRRLRRHGYRVRPLFRLAPTGGGPASWRATYARHLRWLQVIRAQRPLLLASYPLFFFPTLWMVPLVLATAWGALSTAVIALTIVVGTRLTIAMLAARRCGSHGRTALRFGHACLADVTLAAAWASALRTRAVEWRGVRLRLRADGRLESRPDSSGA